MTYLPPTRAERKTATAERILVAAREEFGLKGFSRTTICCSIAVKAGVNSSLVHQYYGSKDLLFTEALGLGAGSHETAATHLGDVVGHEAWRVVAGDSGTPALDVDIDRG